MFHRESDCACAGAAGLQTTSEGGPKIIDVVDGSGDGDVDTSEVVFASRGIIIGKVGNELRVNRRWINPTGDCRGLCAGDGAACGRKEGVLGYLKGGYDTSYLQCLLALAVHICNVLQVVLPLRSLRSGQRADAPN